MQENDYSKITFAHPHGLCRVAITRRDIGSEKGAGARWVGSPSGCLPWATTGVSSCSTALTEP
jgi:hypothetical protein